MAALCGASLAPAAAYKWPGETAGLASAISAKVIGQHCAGLTAPDFSRHRTGARLPPISQGRELVANTPDAQQRSVDGVPSHEVLMRDLAERYAKKYGDPTACGADAAEEAQDTLSKLRAAIASSKPLYADANDPDRKPDIGEAITAKVTGENAAARSPSSSWEIELCGVRQWVWGAKHAVERALGHRRLQGGQAGNRRPKEPDGLHRVAALVRRSEAANPP